MSNWFIRDDVTIWISLHPPPPTGFKHKYGHLMKLFILMTTVPHHVDYFHFHPAMMSTEMDWKTRWCSRVANTCWCTPNSQWNYRGWLAVSHMLHAQKVKGMTRSCRHANFWIAISVSVQWSAGSELTTEWLSVMGFAVRVRSTGQKYGPMGHQRDRADVAEFVTLVQLSSLRQHIGVGRI